jgi:hypothetical protein
MANYSINNFIAISTDADKKIQIRDTKSRIRFTLSPHLIVATFIVGNLVKIKIKANDLMIVLDFATPGEALSALQLLQIQVDKVRLTTPVSVDADVASYVNTVVTNATSATHSTPYFLYQQVVGSNTWLVDHELKMRPNISVYDDNFYEIEGLIRHIDINNSTIYFNQSITGWCICT